MPRHTLRHAATALLAPALLGAAILGPAGAAANAYRQLLVLYAFTAADAGQPMAGLIRDAAGNLYGTESGGNGAVFELSPPPAGAPYKAWKKQTLYTFKGGSDGFNTQSQLYQDAAGNLYGTTAQGGTTGCYNNLGCGTIFELSPPQQGQSAWRKTVLYQFTGGADGAYPGLLNTVQFVADKNGDLYGTTTNGSGAPCSTGGCNRIFELSLRRISRNGPIKSSTWSQAQEA